MLPTQKTPPKATLHEFTVLLYGPTKFGKSKICSQAESALFLETEPGLNSLEVFKLPIGTWDELLAAAKELADGKHAFKTVIIDTVDNAYRMCAEYMCKKFKVEHESDLEYGKGYAMVNNEFFRVLNKLALLPYGLFLISHSQEKEIDGRTGKFTKIVPTLPDKARKLVLGLVDIILFCDFEPTKDADGNPGYKRVLRTKPSTRYEAGDRTDRLPEVIDFDFGAFVAAFMQGASSSARRVAPTPTSGPAPAGPSSARTVNASTTDTSAPMAPPPTMSTATSTPTAPPSTPTTSPAPTATSTPTAPPTPTTAPTPAATSTPTAPPTPTTNPPRTTQPTSATSMASHRPSTSTPITSTRPRASAPATHERKNPQ